MDPYQDDIAHRDRISRPVKSRSGKIPIRSCKNYLYELYDTLHTNMQKLHHMIIIGLLIAILAIVLRIAYVQAGGWRFHGHRNEQFTLQRPMTSSTDQFSKSTTLTSVLPKY